MAGLLAGPLSCHYMPKGGTHDRIDRRPIVLLLVVYRLRAALRAPDIRDQVVWGWCPAHWHGRCRGLARRLVGARVGARRQADRDPVVGAS